ncbi:SseB family protein [Calidifontibacter terrae]
MSDEHGIDPTDSAGRTWQGREVTDTGFGDDDGSADPALLAALIADDATMVAAVAAARLLVPIVAEPTEVTDNGGLTADKAADMAVAVLVAPDGTRALPAFTSMESLGAWDEQARPSPVTAQRAAQAAVSEQCEAIVIDVAGLCVALRPSMVWALAMGRVWVPAHEDDHVAAAVQTAVRDEPDVVEATCADGGEGALRIVLSLRPGLDSGAIGELAQRIGEQLATDGETRARIDAVGFAIRQA